MRTLILSLVILSILSGCRKTEEKIITLPGIVPRPVFLKQEAGAYTVGKNITILALTDDEKNVASFIQEFLNTKNINSTVADSGNGDISLTTSGDSTHGNEGYKLSVTNTGIRIEGGSGAGLFYGVQTLMQLFPVDSTVIVLPIVEINDQPRFSWRGLHLDVGRHFFPVDVIKRYIDLMSHYKLNTFHWHLTEDQGWRIEIKKYPKLQEVAAFRKKTLIGHAHDRPEKFDGQRYGGFYTQEEIKDVVAYATKHYVTVIPEIELPGHALAALAAYPYLGCIGEPYEVCPTWGVFEDVFCAGKETTFEFLQGVLDEVVPLFPSKYVHIGGDECPKDNWKKCPNCKKRMVAEKLKDEHELQSYFIQRIEKYLNSKGKQIIGWDEILEGGLAPNATVMSWRGEEGGIAAAKQNHDVIMTPTDWRYLDYYQDTTGNEPLAIGGYLPLEKVYSYEPVPSQLSAEEANHILGSQANVWTEYIATPEHLEYMVYPRAIALAERVWSPKESKDYTDFIKRLKDNTRLLDSWKVNYAKHALR